MLEYGLTATLFVVGMEMTTAGNAALINAAEPVLIVLAAAIFLGERVGRHLLLLLALVTAGLVFLIGPDLISTGAPRTGDLLIFASAATGALYAIISRRLVTHVAPLPLALTQQAAGLIVLAGVFLIGAALGWIDLDVLALMAAPSVLLLAVGSGLLQHTAAVWLHLHALRRMPAAAFALFLGLVPVFALAGALTLLGETLALTQFVGGALVIAAATSAARRPSATPLSKPKEIWS